MAIPSDSKAAEVFAYAPLICFMFFLCCAFASSSAASLSAAATESNESSAALSPETFPEAPNRNRDDVYPPPRPLDKTSLELYRLNERVHERLPGVRLIFEPQAATPYPIAQRCSVEFLWQRSPTAICCVTAVTPPRSVVDGWPQSWREDQVCEHQTGNETLVYPGVDYLVAYWMSRYSGALGPDD